MKLAMQSNHREQVNRQKHNSKAHIDPKDILPSNIPRRKKDIQKRPQVTHNEHKYEPIIRFDITSGALLAYLEDKWQQKLQRLVYLIHCGTD